MIRFRQYTQFAYIFCALFSLQPSFLFANVSAAEGAFESILQELRDEEDIGLLEELLKDVDLDESIYPEENVRARKKQQESSLAQDDGDPLRLKKTQLNYPLQRCRDDLLGIKLLCDPHWDIEADDDTMMLILSEEPEVTCTMTRIESDVRVIEQLTKEHLQSMGQYRDGFKTEFVNINNRTALQVKAFSKEFPSMRLNDYYVVHDGALYGILYSINPKTAWDKYKFVIKRMTDSLRFLDVKKENSRALTAR